MSKSLKRVRAALENFGMPDTIRETGQATTAQMAADELGCTIDQIVKSIIFRGVDDDACVLFLTAGGNQVDIEKAERLANQALGKADAAFIRAKTGFAIGGVSPIGHLTPSTAFFDPKLMAFNLIWGAAGTPRHVFCAPPAEIMKNSNAQLTDFTL